MRPAPMPDPERDLLPDDLARRSASSSKVVPSHLLDAAPLREPSPEQLERYRWRSMQRFGRHGWAARGTGTFGVCAALVLSAAEIIQPRWLGIMDGDGAAWLLVLGLPVLGGVYRVMLAQWDQEATRFGGGRLSLDAWRDGEAPARLVGDADRDA